MAKTEKTDKIPTAVSSEIVHKLWLAVVTGELGMPEASKKLKEFVNSLPEERQADFRQQARTLGRWLMSVTEGFSQNLTEIGAGQ